jgi:hypothetical protein
VSPRIEDLPTHGLNLVKFADHVLDYVVAFFAANSVALPDARYITAGVPSLDAWDCEQLVLGIVGVTDGSARQGQIASANMAGVMLSAQGVRAASYEIQLVRCCPMIDDYGNAPSVADKHAAGRQQAVDMGLISQAVVNLMSALPPWIPKGVNATAGPVAPVGPTGGFAALIASISLHAIDLMTGTELT